ncbi:MAG: hypothetical protein QM784_16520 [Polyangiaceae bacterium]
MGTGLRSSRLLTALLFSSAFVAGAGAVGCRTTESDVHRWGETQNGPKRLEAVISHDKYSDALRTEAAMTLVRMKARNGKRVGLEGGDDPEQRGLLAVLSSMPKETRGKLIGAMVPALEAGMRSPPADKASRRVDQSFSYKDAAFAILTHDKGGLITNEDHRRRLQDAIAEWVTADFANRMEEPTQIYSMDQVLRYLGARGVKRLPELMTVGATKLDRLSEFVAEFGDMPTRLAASEKLVAIASHVNSAKWLAEREPILRKANQESKLNPKPEQFKAQLDAYQEEELIRLFSSMKKVGGKPVVDYLIAFASDAANSEKRRVAAVAALEGNIDRNETKLVDHLFALASAENTPDGLRDLALRRLSELPRKLVIARLYALFTNDNWKVRFGPADLALRMSDSTEVPEYMTKLGAVRIHGHGGASRVRRDAQRRQRSRKAQYSRGKVPGSRSASARSTHCPRLVLSLRTGRKPRARETLSGRQDQDPGLRQGRQGLRMEVRNWRRRKGRGQGHHDGGRICPLLCNARNGKA